MIVFCFARVIIGVDLMTLFHREFVIWTVERVHLSVDTWVITLFLPIRIVYPTDISFFVIFP